MPWWVTAGASVIAAIVALALLWVLWWQLPKSIAEKLRPEIPDAKARADVEDNFRKTMGQLIGGAAVLAGAGFAYYQTLLTSQASRDQLISQQVSKGFEQVGSDKIPVRLGGIYALEGVMNTSKQYHQPVLEALCAFVRDGTETYTGKGPPATDIQAALTVIGRRVAGTGVADLTFAHVPQADLTGADLTGADLLGAHLTDANLREANLTNANLADADLTDASLSGANLTDANLRESNLTKANLLGAHLTDANLREANLTNANVYNADLMTGADLREANLTNANLTGANLTNADLTKANLTNAGLTGTDLTGTPDRRQPDQGRRVREPVGKSMRPAGAGAASLRQTVPEGPRGEGWPGAHSQTSPLGAARFHVGPYTTHTKQARYFIFVRPALNADFDFTGTR